MEVEVLAMAVAAAVAATAVAVGLLMLVAGYLPVLEEMGQFVWSGLDRLDNSQQLVSALRK